MRTRRTVSRLRTDGRWNRHQRRMISEPNTLAAAAGIYSLAVSCIFWMVFIGQLVQS